MTVSVFLLDDHEIVRHGLKTLLEAQHDLAVVGEAGSAAEALTRIPAIRPDVAMLDVRLPDGEGLTVCRQVRAALDPPPACLMLASYTNDEALYDAILAGAAGYVLKEVSGTNLVDAVRAAAAGKSLMDPALKKTVLNRFHDPRYTSLSPQERRVLELVATGRTNRQIAEELDLAEKTVKNYVSSLLHKLGFSRRTEAAVFVTRRQHRPPAP
ncbi:response regulator [Amycolatopsis taiwanensis]|uniref:DNA-binding response regulator n=1 Tax=Amycolatopsis taiwanensis TaxID=342230 RepID=A0A9W6QZA4_9PSEU|nr:response regulator transcription factor [Amycolatopsis taiwanensis]GLY66731.1 DNA-binding response regulator [Amycolatopsis taiwanensis]